jgi:hypothetical protein
MLSLGPLSIAFGPLELLELRLQLAPGVAALRPRPMSFRGAQLALPLLRPPPCGRNSCVGAVMAPHSGRSRLAVRGFERQPGFGTIDAATILSDLLFGRCPRIQPIQRAFREYDHVILMSPVWGGRIAAPLRTFLRVPSELGAPSPAAAAAVGH